MNRREAFIEAVRLEGSVSTLTIEQVAEQLNGNEYREEGSDKLWADCKRHGIVVVFGASDDLMEFRGAIYDEAGAYNGTKVKLTDKGLCTSECGEGEDCPYFKASLKGARVIQAIFSPKNPDCTFIYKTDIPHATFDIMEDGELYCRGIVFRLADASTSAAV